MNMSAMNHLCTLLAKSENRIWVYNNGLNIHSLNSAQSHFKTQTDCQPSNFNNDLITDKISNESDCF